jgi:hypothetical protein
VRSQAAFRFLGVVCFLFERVLEEAAISFGDVLPGIGWATFFETTESPPPSRSEGSGIFCPLRRSGSGALELMEWI